MGEITGTLLFGQKYFFEAGNTRGGIDVTSFGFFPSGFSLFIFFSFSSLSVSLPSFFLPLSPVFHSLARLLLPFSSIPYPFASSLIVFLFSPSPSSSLPIHLLPPPSLFLFFPLVFSSSHPTLLPPPYFHLLPPHLFSFSFPVTPLLSFSPIPSSPPHSPTPSLALLPVIFSAGRSDFRCV